MYSKHSKKIYHPHAAEGGVSDLLGHQWKDFPSTIKRNVILYELCVFRFYPKSG